MICRNCQEYEKILSIQKSLINTSLDIVVNFKEYAILNLGNKLICDGCGSDIYNAEYYLDEDGIEGIREEIIHQIAEKVKKEIRCCENCGHGEVIHGLKHSIYSIFDEEDEEPEKIFEELEESTDLGDLINDISDWDEDIIKGVINYVSCPNCGNGTGFNYEEKVDYGELDEYTTVYTQQNIDRFNEKFYDEKAVYESIQHEINSIADICTYEELIDLQKEYIRNPLLVQNQSLQKIVYFLKKLYNENKMYIVDEFYTLYRARINKESIIFKNDEMWEPPVKVSSHGRYNPVGLPVLYLSNNKEVIKQEVIKQADEYYNIASFRIKSSMKFLKINPLFPGEFKGFINEEIPKYEEKLIFKVQYIIANIISLIIKDIGFNGVAYLSTKDSRYINFAVLKYEKHKDIEIFEVVQE